MMNIGIESVELENDILSTKYLFIADNNCSLLYFLVLLKLLLLRCSIGHFNKLPFRVFFL